MKNLLRGAGSLLLLTLLSGSFSLMAQDDSPVRVVGSGIVAPIVETLADASETGDAITVDVTGTENGFVAFCTGEADAAMANQPITPEEEAICVQNGVEFDEYLLGHHLVTAVVNPGIEFATCLDITAIGTMLAPSAAGEITDWLQLDIAFPEQPGPTPLTVVLPPANTATSTYLDNVVDGFGLRGDATVTLDDSSVVDAVAGTPGAIGFASLAAVADRTDVTLLDISTALQIGCQTPSAENAEARSYTFGYRLFLYANRSSAQTGVLNPLLGAASDAANESVIAAAGFTAPSAEAYTLNSAVFAGTEGGRQFSLEVLTYEIPPTLAGSLAIAGGAHLADYVGRVTAQFVGTYQQVTVDLQAEGSPAGYRRLCNGEIDIMLGYDGLPAEVAQNCEANDVATVEIDLGAQGVVLLANEASPYLTCLSREQLFTVWGAEASSETPVATWDMVSPDFPADPVYTFSPSAGSGPIDIVLTPEEGPVGILRDDVTERNSDPRYRAAAVANAPGGITMLSWQDYQTVLDSEQTGYQVVSVDGGEGCVEPTEATILDGTYPLNRQASLIVSQSELVRPEVQSLLWFMFSDANYSAYQLSGFFGIEQTDLLRLRADLQAMFAEAQAAALEVAPEGTPEATPEMTPETTPEATPEATPEGSDG